LAELVVRQIGPERLLLDRAAREELVLAIPRTDAEELVNLLDLGETPNPWAALTAVDFRKGQTRTDVLFAFFGCKPPELRESPHEPVNLVRPSYPLFEYQERAYREVLSHLSSSKPPRVLLHMPTGAGKTRTAMAVIAAVLRDRARGEQVVVWLAHTEELCEQAAEEFERAWAIMGARPASVFRYFGPYRVDLDTVHGGFLVAGLQLLYQHSLTYQSAFLALARRVALVVMDEAHQAVAPSYNHLLNLLAPDPAMPILGLSATPGRSSLDAGEDVKLAQFFGRHKVTLSTPGDANPIEFLQREGYLAQVEYVCVPYAPGAEFDLTAQETEELRVGLDLPDSVIKRLAADHRRNFLILTRIMREADQGGRIIVFGCSVEHAKLLANLLRAKGYPAVSVTSETPPDQRRHVLSEFRSGEEVQIVTNYGVLTMGFDAPRTNVAVITRPTRSVVLYSQMVGRAARGPRAGGNEKCRIVTVVDQIPGFRSIAEAFTYWEDIWTDY
jgi:superfamily II DNA or RNA helicase